MNVFGRNKQTKNISRKRKEKREKRLAPRMRGVRKRLVLLGLGILLSAWLNFSFFTLTNHLPPKNVAVAEAQPSKPLSREERPRPSSHLRLSPSPFSHRLPPTPRQPPTTNEPPVAGASAARRTVQSSPEELDPSDLLAELAPLLNEQDDFPSAVDQTALLSRRIQVSLALPEYSLTSARQRRAAT